MRRLKCVIRGVASYIPGSAALLELLRGRGAPRLKATARYCYSVWMRHLVTLYQNGLRPRLDVVMELGPGDSIGVGLAALLSGAEHYVACDVVRNMNLADNLPILDELVELFERRAPIPNEIEFPEVMPRLAHYGFPDYLIEDSIIRDVDIGSIYRRIKNSICDVDASDSCIRYMAPWYDTAVTDNSFVDLVVSQAVLEHVDNLDAMHGSVYRWLRRGGIVSHQIDYKCHNTASQWNGHYTYSNFFWRIIRGRRPYLINREPHSKHVTLLKTHGYRVRTQNLNRAVSKLKRTELAQGFRDLSDDDLTICGAIIQAEK